MRKTILTLVSSAVVIAAASQIAAASDHNGRRTQRAPVTNNEQLRDSNAYFAAPSFDARSDASRYSNGAASAPAGR